MMSCNDDELKEGTVFERRLGAEGFKRLYTVFKEFGI